MTNSAAPEGTRSRSPGGGAQPMARVSCGASSACDAGGAHDHPLAVTAQGDRTERRCTTGGGGRPVPAALGAGAPRRHVSGAIAPAGGVPWTSPGLAGSRPPGTRTPTRLRSPWLAGASTSRRGPTGLVRRRPAHPSRPGALARPRRHGWLGAGPEHPPSPLGPARCPSQAPPRGPGPAGGPGGSSGAPPPSPAPAGRPGQRRGDAPELRRGDRPPDVGHAVRRRPAPDGCPPPHSPPGAAREGRLGARPPRLAGLSRPRLPRRGWPARGQPAAVRRRSQPPKPAWRAIPPWPAAIIPRPRPYAGAWFMVARVNCRAGGAPSPLVLPTLSVVADPRRGGRRGVPVARRAWPRPGPWMRWSGRIAAGS
jgi:hypothetical protein